ncbi:c-type cytochrome [Enterovibrio coralii]|uniref:c-type cytochrome n=1 Tax=Enterovibrio coralii TaxID=294935 RepID=UPI002FC32074
MLNKKQLFTVFPLLIASTMANADWEGDAKLGQEKAYTCQFCHGATGYANVDGYPHINGQNAKYIYNAMLAYQKGERTTQWG